MLGKISARTKLSTPKLTERMQAAIATKTRSVQVERAQRNATPFLDVAEYSLNPVTPSAGDPTSSGDNRLQQRSALLILAMLPGLRENAAGRLRPSAKP